MGGLKAWLAIAALALASGGVAHADAPGETALQPTAWVQITPAPVRLDGRLYEATCSHAAGTDPAYRFWFHRGTSDGLVIFFDGGGACWDDVTCAIPRRREAERDDDGFYKAELIPADNPNRFNGIFDLNNARNPVRDWSFVYVPYCTGDVHSGSNTAHYTDPDTGEPYTIEHRGADNFRAVLQWMKDNLRQPAQILVAGSSAGAYGASTHYPRIRAAFPRGRALMMGDAGQGVMTQAFLDQRNSSWHMMLPREIVPRRLAITPNVDIVARLAARYPHDRFAQYTTAHDITQSSFYALMGAENACVAWTDAMVTGLAERQHAPNFRSYLAAGEMHSILRTPRFYTETSGGAPLAEWLADALRPNATGWDNRACENCMVRPTRCLY
ncbi:MAG: hypothetical protein KF779_11025 [Hyphomonadaceae bacterium]|nr:hypothetical protein [Hyphomonadaceae bacterium]